MKILSVEKNQAIGTNLLNRISQNICAKQKYLSTHFLELSEMILKLEIVGEEKNLGTAAGGLIL